MCIKNIKKKIMNIWLGVALLGIQGLAYANSADNTFGDIADQFQNWVQGSYGRLALMFALCMIVGGFFFGGGAKMLWAGVGLALIIKYGAQILNTIAGVSAEVLPGTAFTTPDSIGWDFVFEAILILAVISSVKKYNKLLKEYNMYRESHGDEPLSEKPRFFALFNKSKK